MQNTGLLPFRPMPRTSVSGTMRLSHHGRPGLFGKGSTTSSLSDAVRMLSHGSLIRYQPGSQLRHGGGYDDRGIGPEILTLPFYRDYPVYSGSVHQSDSHGWDRALGRTCLGSLAGFRYRRRIPVSPESQGYPVSAVDAHR